MVVKKRRKWYIVKRINGKLKWIPTGKENKEEAEMLERAMSLIKDNQFEKFCKIVTAIYDEEVRLDCMDLNHLIVEYPVMAKSLGVKISDETMRKRKNAIGRLSTWCEANTQSVRYANEITVPIAWRFIESLEGANANTQRKVAGELSSVWDALQKRGLATDNPWKTAKPKKDSSIQKHGRAFTLDEVRSILEVCTEDWIRHTVMIGLYTGLRLGDIFRLTWENIDFEEGMIKALKPSKTAKHDIWVTLPLHTALNGYLTRFRAPHGLIVNAPCNADEFGEYHFTKILNKANLECDEKTKLSFHCFRHTFATLLASTGATEQERMNLGGWSNAQTAQIYNHDTTKERKIIEALPSI